jgi:hypothetical protein
MRDVFWGFPVAGSGGGVRSALSDSVLATGCRVEPKANFA